MVSTPEPGTGEQPGSAAGNYAVLQEKDARIEELEVLVQKQLSRIAELEAVAACLRAPSAADLDCKAMQELHELRAIVDAQESALNDQRSIIETQNELIQELNEQLQSLLKVSLDESQELGHGGCRRGGSTSSTSLPPSGRSSGGQPTRRGINSVGRPPAQGPHTGRSERGARGAHATARRAASEERGSSVALCSLAAPMPRVPEGEAPGARGSGPFRRVLGAGARGISSGSCGGVGSGCALSARGKNGGSRSCHQHGASVMALPLLRQEA